MIELKNIFGVKDSEETNDIDKEIPSSQSPEWNASDKANFFFRPCPF